MLTTLSPSAVSPPSANSRACTTSTTVTHSAPTYGPTSTAASTPPSRWPLVPLATGKLSICTAKMNAATEPGQRDLLLVEHLAGPAQADADAAGGDDRRRRPTVGPSMNPSGTCTAPP